MVGGLYLWFFPGRPCCGKLGEACNRSFNHSNAAQHQVFDFCGIGTKALVFVLLDVAHVIPKDSEEFGIGLDDHGAQLHDAKGPSVGEPADHDITQKKLRQSIVMTG